MDPTITDVLRRLNLLERKTTQAAGSGEVGPTIAEFAGTFSNLLGLRGLWFPNNPTFNGNLPDMSGQGNSLVDTVAGAVSLQTNMIAVYPFNGTSQYLRGANASWNQLSGTDSRINVNYRGLTMGGWFYTLDTAPANFKGIMSKWVDNVGNQRSYLLAQNTNGHIQCYCSTDGIAQQSVDNGSVPAVGWHFLVYRFTPSTELAVFVDNTKTTNVTGIPATLFNCTADFMIGAYDSNPIAGSFFHGQYAMAFLCNSALQDLQLTYLYRRTRTILGV